jgi:hypothetical protein
MTGRHSTITVAQREEFWRRYKAGERQIFAQTLALGGITLEYRSGLFQHERERTPAPVREARRWVSGRPVNLATDPTRLAVTQAGQALQLENREISAQVLIHTFSAARDTNPLKVGRKASDAG